MEYGTITHEGLTVTLTQDAYCIGEHYYHNGTVTYNTWCAAAVDTSGNQYHVYWAMPAYADDVEPDSYDWDGNIYAIM
jgi:hypothetical protein